MIGCMAACFEWADSYDSKVCNKLKLRGPSTMNSLCCIGLDQAEQVHCTDIKGTKLLRIYTRSRSDPRDTPMALRRAWKLTSGADRLPLFPGQDVGGHASG